MDGRLFRVYTEKEELPITSLYHSYPFPFENWFKFVSLTGTLRSLFYSGNRNVTKLKTTFHMLVSNKIR